MEDPVFRIPSLIPQDILIIQDIVEHTPEPAPTPAAPQPKTAPEADSIASSGDETGEEGNSEDEVEADIVLDDDEERRSTPPTSSVFLDPPCSTHLGHLRLHNSAPLADSSSDSSPESDSEPEGETSTSHAQVKSHDVDEDDDEEGGPTTTTTIRTKNEVVEDAIVIPKISEVGPDEHLEKVGEVMNIIDKVAIVKGIASDTQGKASEKALDSDTLLVFEDRKVMGYIYETFGPTYQPLYQVKFSEDYPLDPDKVKVAREVFHVPQRSKFVFVSELKRWRGSDASNVHDEEPAEYELEFSDDEQEAAFKAKLKQRRQGSREPSVTPSRHSTPTPSQVRDQELGADTLYGLNPYDAHGAYDMDFAAGPSRPPPIPYDDPYSDQYNMDTSNSQPAEPSADKKPDFSRHHDRPLQGSDRGRGRGRGSKRPERVGIRAAHDSDSRGRRRDRGRGRGRGADFGRQRAGWQTGNPRSFGATEEYSPHIPQSVSAAAIVHVPGPYAGDTGASVLSDYAEPHGGSSDGQWPYESQYSQLNSYGGYAQPQFVQPHINPRFASTFGFNIPFMQQQHNEYSQYGAHAGSGYGSSEGAGTDGWSGNWNFHSGSAGQGQYRRDQADGGS